MEKKPIKITDAYLRKLVGIPGETQRVAIGSGLSLWVTIDRGDKTARTWYYLDNLRDKTQYKLFKHAGTWRTYQGVSESIQRKGPAFCLEKTRNKRRAVIKFY